MAYHRNPIQIPTTTDTYVKEALSQLKDREILYNRDTQEFGIVFNHAFHRIAGGKNMDLPLNFWSRYYTVPSLDEEYKYVLLANITDYMNSNKNNSIKQGFTGIITYCSDDSVYNSSVFIDCNVYNKNISLKYYPVSSLDTIINYNIGKPCIVKRYDEYYLSLLFIGPEMHVSFNGAMHGLLEEFETIKEIEITSVIERGSIDFRVNNGNPDNIILKNGWKEKGLISSNLVNTSINTISYGKNLILAAGEKGAAAYSSDTLNWNKSDIDNVFGAYAVKKIIYDSKERFIAVGDGGGAAYSADGKSWTGINTNFGSTNIYSIAEGNGLYVAVGDKGYVSVSNNLTDWTLSSNTIFSSYDYLKTIAYGNSIFVAGGYNGMLAYSANGVNWVKIENSIFNNSTINCILFKNNLFLAVGDNGSSAYSTDGMSWAPITILENTSLYTIAYNGNKFIVGGDNGAAAYSVNGLSWTEITSIKKIFGYCAIKSIESYDNKFIAAGNNGIIAQSPDGLSWRKTDVSTVGNGIESANDIIYDDNKFIAVGGNSQNSQISYSSDGLSFTAIEENPFGNSKVNAIARGNNKFVIVGNDGKIAYSQTGFSWTLVDDSTFGTTSINAITYSNKMNKFVAVGESGKAAYSVDGVTWITVADTTFEGNNINDITYQDMFIIVGDNGKAAYSVDGVTWTKIANTTFSASYSGSIYSIAYGSDKFVIVGHYGKAAYSNDGITWTAISNTRFTDSILSIIYKNNLFIAVSESGKAGYSSDGLSWSIIDNVKLGYALAYGAGKYVSAGPSVYIYYSYDGKKWSLAQDLTIVSDSNTLNSIAFGNGKFISVGNGNSISYSNDGVIWTSLEIISFTNKDNITKVKFIKDRFYLTTSTGKIATSTDGLTWNILDDSTFEETPINSISHSNDKIIFTGNNKIAYSSDGTSLSESYIMGQPTVNILSSNNNKSVYVAGCDNGIILYSNDGISWKEVEDSTFENSEIISLLFNKNIFIAVSSDGKMAYSEDGLLWNSINKDKFHSINNFVIANNKYFILCDEGKLFFSDDLINWIEAIDVKASNNGLKDICFGNGRYIIVGDGHLTTYCNSLTEFTYDNNEDYSVYEDFLSNNITGVILKECWSTSYTDIFKKSYPKSIAFGNSKFIAIDDSKAAYSTNGKTWNKLDITGDYSLNNITFGNNSFLISCNSGNALYSDDGDVWQIVNDIQFGSSNVNAIIYGLDKFVAVGDDGKISYSSTGLIWTLVNTVSLGTDSLRSIAYGNNTFVAVGDLGKLIYSFDGIIWTKINLNINNENITNIIFGNGVFVTTTNQGRGLYSTDGMNWVNIHDLKLKNVVYLTFGNGNFIALDNDGCGSFSSDGVYWTKITNRNFGVSHIMTCIAFGEQTVVALGYNGFGAYCEMFLGSGNGNNGVVENLFVVKNSEEPNKNSLFIVNPKYTKDEETDVNSRTVKINQGNFEVYDNNNEVALLIDDEGHKIPINETYKEEIVGSSELKSTEVENFYYQIGDVKLNNEHYFVKSTAQQNGQYVICKFNDDSTIEEIQSFNLSNFVDGNTNVMSVVNNKLLLIDFETNNNDYFSLIKFDTDDSQYNKITYNVPEGYTKGNDLIMLFGDVLLSYKSDSNGTLVCWQNNNDISGCVTIPETLSTLVNRIIKIDDYLYFVCINDTYTNIYKVNIKSKVIQAAQIYCGYDLSDSVYVKNIANKLYICGNVKLYENASTLSVKSSCIVEIELDDVNWGYNTSVINLFETPKVYSYEGSLQFPMIDYTKKEFFIVIKLISGSPFEADVNIAKLIKEDPVDGYKYIKQGHIILESITTTDSEYSIYKGCLSADNDDSTLSKLRFSYMTDNTLFTGNILSFYALGSEETSSKVLRNSGMGFSKVEVNNTYDTKRYIMPDGSYIDFKGKTIALTKGEKGDQGEPGFKADGFIGFEVVDGDLILTYTEGTPPDFNINDDGDLIYSF